MADKKFPDPNEIQKEFESFVKGKFGKNIQVFTQALSDLVDQPQNTPDEPKPEKADREVPEPVNSSYHFNYKPKEIKAYLDRFVIDQDEAKKALSISICDHYNHVRMYLEQGNDENLPYTKQNVLILGPTGVGKTYLIKQIAKLIGVPFVKADATRFSETGYMGANVDDLIKDLVAQADGDLESAKFGIVYLDETDKLASRGQNQVARDVSGRGVQLGLLKILEEADIDLTAGNDPASQMQMFMQMQRGGSFEKQLINTKFILFVVSGAFNGLEEVIKKRLSQKSIGFSASTSISQTETSNLPTENYFTEVVTEDLVEYGFEPEFVGRLPVRVSCKSLSEESLYRILTESENSIIDQYKASFKAYGIDLTFDKSALSEIARLAKKENTGARALMTVCERCLREFKFELPSTSIKRLRVDKRLIADPSRKLKNLLKKAEISVSLRTTRLAIEEFCAEFLHQNHLKITLDIQALNAFEKKFEESFPQFQDLSEIELIAEMKNFASKLLEGLAEGLRLIQQNTGDSEFSLNKSSILSPKDTLEEWVRLSYVEKKSIH